MWENGEVTFISKHVFSDAHRRKCCAFVAAMQCEVPIKMTLVGRDGLSDRFTARASAAPRTCCYFN